MERKIYLLECNGQAWCSETLCSQSKYSCPLFFKICDAAVFPVCIWSSCAGLFYSSIFQLLQLGPGMCPKEWGASQELLILGLVLLFSGTCFVSVLGRGGEIGWEALPTLGLFWPRIAEPVQSGTRMGVRGDLLNPVVRNWNETSMPPSLLLTTMGLSGVRSLSQMKCVQVSLAMGLTSLPLCPAILVLAAEITYM